MNISKLLLSAGVFALPFTANAADANKYYVALTGEYIASAKATGDGTVGTLADSGSIKFDSGEGVLVAIGYYVAPAVRVEFEGGYKEIKEKSQTIAGLSFPSTAKDKALSTMGNAYYDFQTGTNLTPYIGAGLGWGHETTNGGADAFAYQGMLGVNYKVSETSTVFGGYRYLGTTDFSEHYVVSGLSVTENAKITASSIDVGYRYSF